MTGVGIPGDQKRQERRTWKADGEELDTGAEKKSAREGPSRAPVEPWSRYGRLTVVPSPVAEMLKVPAALLGAYE
jgi:hypothetical protein